MKSILQVIQELIKPYIDKIAKNIAPVEVSPSEHSYTVGKSLIFKGVMYKVTSAIAVNDDLEVGVNIIADTDMSTKKLSTYTADATAWDTAPTENSTKPVTSGGVYQAITSVSIDDMTGATVSTDGVHGLVPAPLIADREKFLRGDGTWAKDYTELTANLAAGNTQVTFSDAAITATADVSIKTNMAGLNWTAINDSTAGTLIITYPAQSVPVTVKLIIRG